MAEFLDSNSPSGGHVESSDTVIQKLKQAIYAISEKSMKSKSVVWEQFGVVCNEDNIIQLPFVACRQCHAVFHYSGRQTGTSMMKRHKCVTDGQASLVDHIVYSERTKISKMDKQKVGS